MFIVILWSTEPSMSWECYSDFLTVTDKIISTLFQSLFCRDLMIESMELKPHFLKSLKQRSSSVTQIWKSHVSPLCFSVMPQLLIPSPDTCSGQCRWGWGQVSGFRVTFSGVEQGSRYLDHLLVSLRERNSKKLELGVKSGLELGHPHMGHEHPKWRVLTILNVDPWLELWKKKNSSEWVTDVVLKRTCKPNTVLFGPL